jgi:tyrosyl-tRNA synthetase
VHALATPLITRPDGTKYGKSEGDAIWLSAELMSPYAFHQYWLNRSDAEVPGLLKVFTFRTREEIEDLEREISERPAARTAQRVLADDLTTLVHGADQTARATAAARALFGQGNLSDLDEATLAAAFAEVPHAAIGRLGPTVTDLMAACGLVPTKSAARRAVGGGGAYLNNVKVTDIDAVPGESDLLHGRFLVLRHGKRSVGGIQISG